LVLGGILLLWSGCASLRDLRIDPTGSCLFTRQQSGVSQNVTGESSQPPSVANPSATTAFPQPGTESAASTADTTSPNPFTYDRFPGGFGNVVPGTGIGAGFTGSRGLDGFYVPSTPPDPVKGPALILTPKVHFAPIHSEVVVVASYLGNDEYLRTNQPVEWSLDGTGTILTYDTGSWCDWLHHDFTKAQKISDRYVKTKTSANLWTINRGTPDTKDDIEILKGQTWVTLKATKEGTSYVTALSPTIDDWSKRSASAAIHWIDAQFAFPRPMVAPVGDPRKLTTIVSRQSNGSPRSGWFVEYEVIGGTAAGFGENLAQRTKIETDNSGQASVDVYQKEAGAGTATIVVRVIRPDTGEGNQGELVVGSQIIRQIWTSGGVLKIDITGPKDPVADRDYTWKVNVVNMSSRPTGATVQLRLPYGMKYVSSGQNVPIPQSSTNVVQWEVNSIPGNGTYTMDVVLRADGSIVGSGRNMDVTANVFARAVGSKPTNVIDGGSVPTYNNTPQQAPTPPGVYSPTPPKQPAQPASTPTSGRFQSSEISMELSVYKQLPNGGLLKAPAPYVINKEYNLVLLTVVGPDNKDLVHDLKNVSLVIHPPQRNNQSIDGALECIRGSATEPITRSSRQWVRKLSTFPIRDANGVAVDNSLTLEFKPLRVESNLELIGEFYAEGKKLGQCHIIVSVQP